MGDTLTTEPFPQFVGGLLTPSPPYVSSDYIPLVRGGTTYRLPADTFITSSTESSGINQLAGDVTAGPGGGSQTATLAVTGVTAGGYTYADLTIDAKGRVTSATNGAPATTSALGIVKPDGTTITVSGGTITAVAGSGGITQLTGDVAAGPGGGSQAATLATVNTDVGAYTLASITVNAKGLVTSASNGTLPSDIAYLDVHDQTLSGGANVTSHSLGTVSSGTVTVDCGQCPLQYLINGGAFILAAPINDGSTIILATNNASAGAITFSGFSVGSNTGDALNTTNTNKFSIFVWRINGTSGYRVAAHQ